MSIFSGLGDMREKSGFIAEFSDAYRGWCVYTTELGSIYMAFWAGPFSEESVAVSEAKRLNRCMERNSCIYKTIDGDGS